LCAAPSFGTWQYGEAKDEFEALRELIATDAVATFRLATHLLDIGLYYSAIQAARQVLRLAGLESQSASLTAPAYFNHLRYGCITMIWSSQKPRDMDLTLSFCSAWFGRKVYSRGFISSTASAHGLMQIVPATGAEIAGEVDWPPAYSSEDLFRPIVSVRFGAHYLDKNRDLLDGNLYAGLAAYNAGPGNALAWRDLAGNDLDLLLEVIASSSHVITSAPLRDLQHLSQLVQPHKLKKRQASSGCLSLI